MSWAAFYFLASLATVFFAYGGVKQAGRKQHIIGAHALFWAWVASWAARNITGNISPVEWYAVIDIAMLIVFGGLMFWRRAIWACICVFLHAGMAVAHVRYYYDAMPRGDYLELTNILFFLSLVTLISAITTGRFTWGEAVDRFLPRPFGYTFSGLVVPRNADSRRSLA